MSESCCVVPQREQRPSLCPKSGHEGKPVDWLTVAALSRGQVPARQDFWLCYDRECEVVYFGSADAVLTLQDVSVVPGFKNGGDGLVCYCFHHRTSDIARDLSESGSTGVFDSIKDEVKVGNCACEVRNPSGKCCLGDVQKTIRRLEAELGVRA